MLATWSVFGLTDIHVMNANRTVLGAAMNILAIVLFVIARKIWWPQTMVMLVATVIGGYFGARYGQESEPAFTCERSSPSSARQSPSRFSCGGIRF